MERGTRLNQSKSLFDFLALCAVVTALIGGLIVRSRLPIIPLADGDTWGYLRPALSWLSGLGFQQTYGRDWFYPALLAAILKISGDFSAIVYVQRFLGLAGIFLFWLAWRSWFRLIPVRKPVWLCFFLSILPLALYALSSQQALLENTIRPEGIFAFFEMAYLYCLISFFLARWTFRRTGSAIGFGAALLGLSYAILLLKPNWGFSSGFTFLCLVAGAFGRTRWPLRFGPLLGGAAAFVLLFSLPKWFGFQKDTQLFLPFTLVSIHAEQILKTRPDMVSPGAHNPGLPDQTFYEELAKAYWPAKENPDHYYALGFDPDYIQYRSGFFSTIMQKEAWSDREMATACYCAYFRAWLQAPSSMLEKVGKQLRLFFFPRGGDFYKTTQSIDLNNELTSSRPFLPDSELSADVQKTYQLYRQKLERPEGNSSNPIGLKVLARLAHYIAWIAGWLQLIFVTVLLTVCLGRKGRKLRFAGLVILAVLAATYGSVLTIAVVHSLDVVRYRISYAPGFLLGLALITNYLLTLAFGVPMLGKQHEESTAIEVNSAPASRSQR
jgi:hypothetical protein